jgi:hypothetical protein
MGEEMTTKFGNVVPLRSADQAPEAALREARVIFIDGADASIRIDGRLLPARIAFSCLVRPAPDDLCLCARLENGDHCILGILERPGSQDMTLSFPADATLASDNGALAFASGKSLTLASDGALTCISDRVVHKSREAVVDYATVVARGEDLKASYTRVTLIGQTISTVARQAIQKFVSYIRHTEEVDQIKAGQMTRGVDGLYALDSKYTMMTSKKDTKIDAERIFMG